MQGAEIAACALRKKRDSEKKEAVLSLIFTQNHKSLQYHGIFYLSGTQSRARIYQRVYLRKTKEILTHRSWTIALLIKKNVEILPYTRSSILK